MRAKKIKTHLLDNMQNAPFVQPEYEGILPCEYVEKIDDAELIVGRKKSMFDIDDLPKGRQYLLWTHEPFFDATSTWVVRRFLPSRLDRAELYVFNVHNGGVYTDNFYLAPRTGRLLPLRDKSELNVAPNDRTLTFAATYKLGRLMVDGADVSLNERRCLLALQLHERDRLKIIGRGWPEGVSEEDSRYVNRARSKGDFLKSSNLNFCYENCCTDYYVTEKLWEAIHAGCLPIYYSNETIYQTFPKNSFIDGRDFSGPDDLLAFIDAMSVDELISRINLCRAVYNDVVLQARRVPSRERSLKRLIRFLDIL